MTVQTLQVEVQQLENSVTRRRSRIRELEGTITESRSKLHTANTRIVTLQKKVQDPKDMEFIMIVRKHSLFVRLLYLAVPREIYTCKEVRSAGRHLGAVSQILFAKQPKGGEVIKNTVPAKVLLNPEVAETDYRYSI
eukprot:gb/GECG01000024.1/.p1 GENE.gb/GECG01000024.1/~~gb/GECG01000024.1/.p1  ORF type:complete len:137 (+),score=10.06 gb/GECG01000024.1/:1-411(+)